MNRGICIYIKILLFGLKPEEKVKHKDKNSRRSVQKKGLGDIEILNVQRKALVSSTRCVKGELAVISH